MNGSLAIPEGLRQQFNELEKRLLRFDTIIAVCGCLSSLLLSYALIFISDRFWDTPRWIRVIFTGGGIVAAGWFVRAYGRRWIWGSRSLPTLANLVQKRYRRLGDRLLGIVELADEAKRPANFSAALCKAAISQVAEEAAKIDFRQAVETKRPRRYLLGVAAAGAVAAAFCIVAPQAGWNALLRWLQPTVNVARYTFVNFDHLPDHLVVAHGEPFELAVGLSAHSLLQPSHLTARFEKQSPVVAPVKGGIALLRLPGQTEPGVLSLWAGDMERQIRIEPAFRPELKQLTAHIQMPAYLLYPEFDQKIDGGSLTFLKGSRITLKGQTTRALNRAATIDANGRTPLKVERDTFLTAPLTPQGAAQLAFTWKDELGLDNAEPAKVRLQQVEDQPPGVECPGMAAAIAILEEEVVHVDIAADDDYGILDVGVQWQTTPQKADQKPGPLVTHKIIAGSPRQKTLKCTYDFSPQLLHIPPDTNVAFCATVTDRFPNRAPSLSEVHQIYILSRESHARLIEQQLEKQMAQLEELTRQQEALRDAAKEVRDQPPDKLKNTDSGKKLDEQKTEQKETADQLAKLAQQVAGTVSEAARNKDISPSSLEDWAKHAAEMNDLAQQNMPDAAQSLGDSKDDADNRAPKLDQALSKEDEILKKMHEMQKSTENSLQKLTAETIAMRLRKIAGSEKSIASDFQKILPDTIGMRFEQLPGEQRQAVDDMAALNETSRGESEKLQGEISRLAERTQLAKFSDVSNEMESLKTDDALTKLTDTIQKNVTVEAMKSATDWSKQFNQWADHLGSDDNSQSQASSGGGSGEDSANMKTMMALMQLRQQEDALRDQTAALDHQKKSNPDYGKQAETAAKRQQEIEQSLEQLGNDPGAGVQPGDLAPIGKAMTDAGTQLGKPETGDPAVGAETDAINLLDEAIAAGGKKGGKSMAGLMQMMGIAQTGNTPGGNPNGGDTTRKNIQVAGSRAGAGDDKRHTAGASGNAGEPVPAEFREAIESYQHAVEQGGSTP